MSGDVAHRVRGGVRGGARARRLGDGAAVRGRGGARARPAAAPAARAPPAGQLLLRNALPGLY